MLFYVITSQDQLRHFRWSLKTFGTQRESWTLGEWVRVGPFFLPVWASSHQDQGCLLEETWRWAASMLLRCDYIYSGTLADSVLIISPPDTPSDRPDRSPLLFIVIILFLSFTWCEENRKWNPSACRTWLLVFRKRLMWWKILTNIWTV